jgi:GTP-binding protein EngB required for normal cell division
MEAYREQLHNILIEGAARLGAVDALADLVARLESLSKQIYQPCVVAVVGRVKAGKSTFINALLGEDLAKVGTTETTATINYFSYGTPELENPVICHWRGGGIECVDRAFLDELQGNDIETLRRADGIERLEYRLLNPYLERVTLVDTPGTGAVVEEHQDRTAEFLTLYSQLRERHDNETRVVQRDADAVVYLIGSSAATTTDRDFLEAFNQITGQDANPMNAVGVLSKIDLNPTLMERRHELSNKIGSQLQDTLNMIVPVSAGLHRALTVLKENDSAGLRKMAATFNQIPPALMKKMLSGESLYLGDFPDCPISVEAREILLGEMPWMVFATIASELTKHHDPMEALSSLEEMSGFGELRTALELHFFHRSDFLRSYRVITDARQALNLLRYSQLPAMEKETREPRAQLEKFVKFTDSLRSSDTLARDLHAYLLQQLETIADTAEMTRALAELDTRLSMIYHELVEYNADFTALQMMNSVPEYFTEDELTELRPLLGQYGLEQERRLPQDITDPLNYVKDQQMKWRNMSWDCDESRRYVIERATARYGLVMRDLVDI